MARFFLHLRDKMGLLCDPEERADLDAAHREAIQCARAIVADDALCGAIDLSGRIEIADDTGAILLAVHFRDAVAVHGL